MRFNSTERPCAVCGAPVLVKPSRARAGRGLYCGLACRDKAYRRPKRPLAERLWDKVARGLPDDCWPWTGATDQHGYGILSSEHGGSPLKAHRVAWRLTFGAIPPGHGVLHTCDNPPCCNPAHLFTGTQGDNMADCAAKGRTRNMYSGSRAR